jgi:DNA modification methylase
MSVIFKPSQRAADRQSVDARLQVVYRPIHSLKLDPKNTRFHSRRQVRQIAKSVKAFGFNVPVLVDSNLAVVAGHGRVLACRELGWTEAPTICLEHLNEAQKRAFMIADNRLTENSRWDDKLLAEQLQELSSLDLDFNLEATGFEIGEIDLRIESLSGSRTDEEDSADEVPPVNAGAPISRFGDLWRLGRHLIICGDSLDPHTYSLLLEQRQASMVFSDPPYNVRIEGHVSGLGKITHREFAMASGEMDEAGFINFLTTACDLAARHSNDGAIHFVCIDWRHVGELLAAGRSIYSELKNICVWVKHNAGMGSFYRSQHELVFVFKNGRGSHQNNVELGRFGRHRTNVWTYRGANSLGRETEEGNLLAFHPTVKPIALVADAILDCSARGEVVLDPFLGSGTTLLAAERTGRCCCGIEIDPIYIDVVIRRWRDFSGEDAHHATTGKTFTEMSIQRSQGDADNRRADCSAG